MLVAACGGDDGGPAATDVTAVVYRFNDSSVPPEFHRSYELTVSATEANLVVDSYGDALHDVTQPIDAALWDSTVTAALAYVGDGAASDDPDSIDCAGGTSDELAVVDRSSSRIVELFVDHCGGIDPDLSLVVAPVLATFDMATLLAPTET